MTQRETLEDIYTRKVGGERYSYRLEYTPGAQVDWRAEVFQDNEPKGSPSGQLRDNTLEGAALRQSLIALVEVTIENMLGIAE